MPEDETETRRQILGLIRSLMTHEQEKVAEVAAVIRKLVVDNGIRGELALQLVADEHYQGDLE